jgi:hypothetical protein
VLALEILVAVLLVFGTALVFRALLDADRFLEEAPSSDVHDHDLEEPRPLRQAA